MVMPGIQQLTRQAGYEHNLPPKEAIIEKKDYRGAQKLLTARGDGAQNLHSSAGQNSAPKASMLVCVCLINTPLQRGDFGADT